jgi:hypothetical protein
MCITYFITTVIELYLIASYDMVHLIARDNGYGLII